eukprot:TRINITY_DN32896_c0_g1_i1.p1 TRINITY_DN32896_c0_g1~~TRINITY_DN32896_c0_g1_i1.p1  ORF type:complete len:286 (+),score=74.36 TRINITY_DN32896_c0_g1_i1:96-953(+)
MTEGRFESSVHGVPREIDHRPHWASHNRTITFPFRKFDAETRQKESCPFHDLRAQGQFQPEIHNIGDGDAGVGPDFLVRKVGPRMKCGLRSVPQRGTGGGMVPIDATPAPPPARPRGDKPWTATTSKGAFGSYPYMSLGPAEKDAKGVAANRAPFHCGKVPQRSAPYEHLNDSCVDGPRRRDPLRLRTGKGGALFDSAVHRLIGGTDAPPPAKKPSMPRPVYLRKNVHGLLGDYPPYMPEKDPSREEPRGAVKRNLRPIYTWTHRTKRCMPISATWTATKVESRS